MMKMLSSQGSEVISSHYGHDSASTVRVLRQIKVCVCVASQIRTDEGRDSCSIVFLDNKTKIKKSKANAADVGFTIYC